MTKKQLNDKKYRSFHKEQIALGKKRWYQANKIKLAKKRKLLYEVNKEKINAKRRLKNQLNPEIRASARKNHAVKISIYNKLYRTENSGIIKAIKAKRRAAKLNRTPIWLTNKDFEKIEEFYTYATLFSEASGIQYDVDHIIPLLGKTVSGLHIPENLQIITHKENCIKKNKFPYNIGK